MKREKKEEQSKLKIEPEEMQTKSEPGVKELLFAVILFLLPPAAFFVYEFIFDAEWPAQMPKLFYLLFYGLAFFYSFLLALKKNQFTYYVRIRLYRFLLLFAVGLLLCILNIRIPFYLWFYLPVCVMLTLFSNALTAVGAFFYLLFFQSMLMEMELPVFLVFSLIGVIGIVLFGDLDEEFLFGLPLFSALLSSTVLLLLLDFGTNGKLTFDSALFAAIHLFVCFLTLTLCLKYLSLFILHKDRDKFQEINDPEYVLLTELKEKSAKDYYHAVHTAYFSEKIARKIGADEMLAKAGGYYHKIGRMRGNQNMKYIHEIAKEYDFPPELVRLLKEYAGKNTKVRSKEAAIVIFADAMVSSVTFLFEKDKNAKLDYGHIANVVFQKQMDSGVFDHCQITMDELTVIRKTFVEENLYYDFLR